MVPFVDCGVPGVVGAPRERVGAEEEGWQSPGLSSIHNRTATRNREGLAGEESGEPRSQGSGSRRENHGVC